MTEGRHEKQWSFGQLRSKQTRFIKVHITKDNGSSQPPFPKLHTGTSPLHGPLHYLLRNPVLSRGLWLPTYVPLYWLFGCTEQAYWTLSREAKVAGVATTE